MAIIPITGSAHSPITSEMVTVLANRPSKYTDEAALRLVVQDANRAEMFLDQKQWTLGWRETDLLYQSPRSIAAFDGTNVSRANVSRFTVAKHVNSLVPTMMGGLFYDSPPFVLRPRPGTTESDIRAHTALDGAMLDRCKFKANTERGMFSQCLNGTGIWKAGWIVTRKTVKKYVRKTAIPTVNLALGQQQQVVTQESDEFDVIERETTESRPFFEFCPLGTVLVDPGWNVPNDINAAKYIIHRTYPTFKDLDELRDQKGYDIPAREVLKEFFFGPTEVALPPSSTELQQQSNATIHHAEGREQKTTEDPLEQPLRMDERWDRYNVMTVLQDKLIIRNEQHGMSRKPFFSANWWDIQNAGLGLGVGRLIGSDQRVEAGAMNGALDILAYSINPQWVRAKGSNAPTQQIRQRLGGIIDVDGDTEKAFRIIEQPKVPAEVWQVIANSKQSAESTSGADEAFSQGNMPQRGSSIGRTATGAAGIAGAKAARIEGPLGRFIEGVFIPFMDLMDEFIRERMPVAEIREVLGQELGDEFVKSLDMESFMNAQYKREVLAGAHLAAKKAMAQSLPLMIQIFDNPHLVEQLNTTGWVVDVKELFEMLMEMSEWKNTRDVIRKMTAQEQRVYQQAKQMNAQQQKLQADVAKINAKHQAASAEIDQKGEVRLAEKLTTHAVTDQSQRASDWIERQELEHAASPHGVAPAESGQFFTAAQ
jgi:hypothetical protein